MDGGGNFEILLVLAGGSASAIDRASGNVGQGDAQSALAALRPRRGAAVVVASDTVFFQNVRLPTAQTDGLSPQELESALFYEVEPFLGIPRDEALVGFAGLPGGEWNVAAVSRQESSKIRAIVESAHCRLAGITASPKGAESSPSETLAALFPEGGAQAPVIAPPRRSPLDSRNMAMAFAAVIAFIALCCLGDWIYLKAATSRLAPRLAESEAAAAVNARIKSQTQAAEGRLAEIESARLRRETAARDLAQERGAWLSLLSTLARETGGDFALLSIDAMGGDKGGASAQCVAPTANAATDAMARLSAALSGQGWTLRPGSLREGQGGLALFSFELSRRGREGR